LDPIYPVFGQDEFSGPVGAVVLHVICGDSGKELSGSTFFSNYHSESHTNKQKKVGQDVQTVAHGDSLKTLTSQFLQTNQLPSGKLT
jgi:hypothetical protein